MINISVDEAYALDFLSILEVKVLKCETVDLERLSKIVNFYRNQIAEQIGDDLFQEISQSKEYCKLKDCNKDLFDAIDYAKTYETNALIIDNLGYLRWVIKNELQKKFFGRPISETKIGYRRKK